MWSWGFPCCDGVVILQLQLLLSKIPKSLTNHQLNIIHQFAHLMNMYIYINDFHESTIELPHMYIYIIHIMNPPLNSL